MVKKSTRVVSKGVRKCRRSIKKLAEMYYVPLSYVGLVECTQQETYDGSDRFSGTAVVDSPNGPVEAYVSFKATMKHVDSSRLDLDVEDAFREAFPEYEGVDIWGNREAYRAYRQYEEMVRDNMSDITRFSVKGGLTYSFTDNLSQEHSVGTGDSPEFGSIEDFIDWATEQSNTLWGDIAVEAENVADSLPEIMYLSLPDGEMVLLEKHASSSGESITWCPKEHSDYTGTFYAMDVEEDGVRFVAKVKISNRAYDYGYSYLDGFKAEVTNTIIDNNETVFREYYWRHTNDVVSSKWDREFEFQNETAEAVVAKVEGAIAETYAEYQAYLASEREYVERKRGVGLHRETVNSQDWEYYPGDNPDYVDDVGVYTSSARKSRSFNAMVKSQRAKNKH